jgi:RNA polymerase sigma-70 factor (ECF subfamily)
MSEERRRGPNEGATPGTLGALLYADPTRERVPESDWVALVGAVASGDELALHALYERAHRLAFTVIMRIVHDSHTADELTVDVFHDVWRRASGYEPANGTVLGWIMNLARSRAIDRHRFEHRKKRVDPQPGQPSMVGAIAEADAALEREDEARRLREAIASLSADERKAVETAFFSELTYVEAAERLDQPLGTLKTRIRSALGKLRVSLAKQRDEP